VESDDRLFFVAQAPTGLNDQLWNLEQGTTTSVKNTTKESMGKNCQVVDNIIAFDHPLTMIKVYDLTGKLLMSGDSSTRFLDISKLPMGYLYWSGIDAYTKQKTTRMKKYILTLAVALIGMGSIIAQDINEQETRMSLGKQNSFTVDIEGADALRKSKTKQESQRILHQRCHCQYGCWSR